MTKFLMRLLKRLNWWGWEWSLGVNIDQDGGVDGSGILVRIELPRWLRPYHWIRVREWMNAHTPESEKFMVRQDISDALLASLLTGVRPEVLERSLAGYAPGVTPEITWVEDRLNPRPWRL